MGTQQTEKNGVGKSSGDPKAGKSKGKGKGKGKAKSKSKSKSKKAKKDSKKGKSKKAKAKKDKTKTTKDVESPQAAKKTKQGKGKGKKDKKDKKAAKVASPSPVQPVHVQMGPRSQRRPKLSNKLYEKELARLQVELVRMQKWVQNEGLRIAMIFEGRDAAGKGGSIKRITQSLNPRVAKVVALPKPTDREQTQWYFQRYIAHLPAAGEIVIFDRSWYNRAGVERVMGFCTDDEYDEFMRSCPQFERMLVRSGIKLIKYWFSVSDDEQERRFRQRMDDPVRRWKISDMDLASRNHWVDYSKAKDEMFRNTDIGQARWYVVNGDDKKRARLNVIAHLLSLIPYHDVPEPKLTLPERQVDEGYRRPPMEEQTFVPEIY